MLVPVTLVRGRAHHWRQVDRPFRPVSAYRYHTGATSKPRFARDVDLCVAPPYLPGAQGFRAANGGRSDGANALLAVRRSAKFPVRT